jgi:hypothetical protein
MVVQMSDDGTSGEQPGSERIAVTVHVETEVLSPKLARRHANVWLTMNAGHLLLAKNPELLLGDLLEWRFNVFLSTPNMTSQGRFVKTELDRFALPP